MFVDARLGTKRQTSVRFARRRDPRVIDRQDGMINVTIGRSARAGVFPPLPYGRRTNTLLAVAAPYIVASTTAALPLIYFCTSTPLAHGTAVQYTPPT